MSKLFKNIGILTNAFGEERLISGCIEQFKPFLVDHLVLNSISPWSGYDARDYETAQIALKRGAKVITKNWKNEAEQFNYGIEKLSHKDWILIVDADERYCNKEIIGLINDLNDFSEEIKIVKTNAMEVYWKTSDYRIIPEQTDHPIIAVRPSVRFTKMREASDVYTYTTREMHHFSYVRNDEEMLRKIKSFSHSDEIVDNWYKDIWQSWNIDMKNLHPVVPSQFRQAIHLPCPDELIEFLPER